MKCTQPGCTGSIVDGYCDVCGSPGATSGTSGLGPAASTSAGAVSVAVGQRAGGCRQPGCTGTIVDGYCDVCGTPGDATPAPAATGSSGSSAGDEQTGVVSTMTRGSSRLGSAAIGSQRAGVAAPRPPSG